MRANGFRAVYLFIALHRGRNVTRGVVYALGIALAHVQCEKKIFGRHDDGMCLLAGALKKKQHCRMI